MANTLSPNSNIVSNGYVPEPNVHAYLTLRLKYFNQHDFAKSSKYVVHVKSL